MSLLTEKPILFNTEMVKAILEGRKTQTRRVIPYKISSGGRYEGWREEDVEMKNGRIEIFTTLWRTLKAKYKVGDVLWVRESAKILDYMDYDAHFEIIYQFSDGTIGTLTHDDLINKHKLLQDEFENKYLSKKYMEKRQKVPNGCLKEMARIFLKVTNVRVERLQDITLADMICEGINHLQEYSTGKVVKPFTQIKREFINLWNSTAKDGYKWEDNPYVFVYVFVYEFERLTND